MNLPTRLVAARAAVLPALIVALGFVYVGVFAQEETTESPTVVPSETPAAADASSPAPSSSPLVEQLEPEGTPRPAPPPRRSWFGRMLHPFSRSATPVPQFRDSRLSGLTMDVQISPQPTKLSEVRQVDVKVRVTNVGKKGVNLDFPNEQRIEIYLLNSDGVVLTKWSENHAFKDKPGTLLINPDEHVEYNEKISTRELTPDKVFIAEAFFPKYPDLRVRQKFLTEP